MNKDILYLYNITMQNSIDDILKKRLLTTNKKRLLNNLFIKSGYSRSQAIKTTQKYSGYIDTRQGFNLAFCVYITMSLTKECKFETLVLCLFTGLYSA